jgi:hypothetical protein
MNQYYDDAMLIKDDAMKIKIEVGWNEQDIDGKIGQCIDESGKK